MCIGLISFECVRIIVYTFLVTIGMTLLKTNKLRYVCFARQAKSYRLKTHISSRQKKYTHTPTILKS